MGIPHLQTFLQPYATRAKYSSAIALGDQNHQNPRQSYFEQNHLVSSTTPDSYHQQLPARRDTSAIIDGPSLAYHVYYISAARADIASDRVVSATPSYRVILTVLFAWLDALSRHGLCLSAIIFDGALPAAKKTVRLQRLASSTRAMQVCKATWNLDYCRHLNLGESHSDPSPQIVDSDLFSVVQPPSKAARLPAPPFLVPAVIEALMASPFAPITHVVPAEADPFCAAFARANGGIVFTADSDLLVYDLGLTASVMFLRDIEYNSLETGSSLQGQIYEHSKIAGRFGLRTLESLAYAVQEDHHRGFGECLNHARRLEKEPSRSYVTFLEQYDIEKLHLGPLSSLSSPLRKQLSRLDPRISEWVHEVRAISDSQGSSKLDVDIYLPVIIEDPDRASPWKIGTDVRRLAYSVLNPRETAHFNTHEYFRSGPRISSNAILHLSRSDTLQAVEKITLDLADVIRVLPSDNEHPSWRQLGLFWLCNSMLADGKSIPSKDELRALLIPDASRGWSHIHLFAQLQAIVYSWRILTQCLNVFLADNTAHSTPYTVLAETIHSVQGCHFPQLLDPVHDLELKDPSISLLLDTIYSKLGADDRSVTSNSKKRRMRRTKANSNTVQLGKGKSPNMYDILAKLGSQ